MLRVATKLLPSPLHGLGLFAAEDITKGTVVCRLSATFDRCLGKIHHLPDVAQAFVRRFGYRMGNRWFLDADDARFMNHSLTPNVASSFDTDDDVALRDIAAGEELTVNYFRFDETAADKVKA